MHVGFLVKSTIVSFSALRVKPLTNLNLYLNWFGWQLITIYFHLKLLNNANNANFGSFEKTRIVSHVHTKNSIFFTYSFSIAKRTYLRNEIHFYFVLMING